MAKSKRTLKIILWIFVSLLLLAGGTIAFLLFGGGGKRNALSVIPDDAIYIIETSNVTEAWESLSESKMWKHLLSSPKFESINSSIIQLDSLIKGNKTLDMLFSDRQMAISAHMTEFSDYDFIFAIDLKKSSKISYLKNYIKDIVGYYELTMGKRNYEGTEIVELTNTENEILSLCFIDNVMLASYTPVLIEKAVQQKDNEYWIKNSRIRTVTSEIKKGKLFNLYINYTRIYDFLRSFSSDPGDIVKSLSQNLFFTALNVTFNDEMLEMEGYTSVNDSFPSYFKALSEVKAGKWKAYEVISQDAAMYISMSFNDQDDFFDKLREVFSSEDTLRALNYEETIKKVEKYLKIDLQEDFFSWIGNEIAFVKMRPSANAREEDVIALLHTSDIEKAQAGMEKITRNIKNKTLSLAKFKETEYKNFTIHYLNYSWFLKLFFGKLFNKLEKPYFTYMDDYIVFSNSPSALMDAIDHFTVGRTLAHNKEFMAFVSNFNEKANITAFVMMPKIYSHLYNYSKADKRKNIKDNKELILSFTRIGFQLVSDDGMFETRLIADFDEDAAFSDELERLEAAAEELLLHEIDSGAFVYRYDEENPLPNGPVKIYHDDSITICFEGRVVNNKPDGLWRGYYPDGQIMSAVNYEKGKPNGIALFYYDNEKQTTCAEATYKDGLITGTYREFYENGNRKAMITFSKEGVPDGEAEFYYDSGVIKIEGRYKEGVKEGKWRHFTETGELIDKAKWKKGNQKNKK